MLYVTSDCGGEEIAAVSRPVEVKEDCPRVTIIMPVRNAARFIDRSLAGLLAQNYPRERIEVLIVDGMSEDATRGVIQRLISRLEEGPDASARNQDMSIRVLDNPCRVVPVALNIGLHHASGEVIFRLDGHSEMAPDYVSKCLRKLMKRPDVACVGGPSVATGSGWVGETYASALRSPFGAGGRTFRTLRTESYVDTLAFGCYRREIFSEVGGFDPELCRNQDIEFSARLRKAGYRLLLIGDTQTTYHAPQSIGRIIQQNYKNGYWNTRALNKMVGVLSLRHFVPAVFVLSVLISTMAALMLSWGWYLQVAISGSYVVASLIASASIAMRSRPSTAVLLPPMFATIHISYGVGSLIGFCRYIIDSGLKRLRRGAK